MKLFCTGNINIVRECQIMLNFQLHSELLEKRTKKFIHDYDKFAAPLLYILMFIVVNDIAKFLFVCVILL